MGNMHRIYTKPNPFINLVENFKQITKVKSKDQTKSLINR